MFICIIQYNLQFVNGFVGIAFVFVQLHNLLFAVLWKFAEL
jgi:hypothetical protein